MTHKHVITFSNVSLVRMTALFSVVSNKVYNKENNFMILSIVVLGLPCTRSLELVELTCMNFMLVCNLELARLIFAYSKLRMLITTGNAPQSITMI
jgi:hypothetical protein